MPPESTVLADAGPDTPSDQAHGFAAQARREGIELDEDVAEHCPGWNLAPTGPRSS